MRGSATQLPLFFSNRISMSNQNPILSDLITLDLNSIISSDLPSYLKILAKMIQQRNLFPIGEYFENLDDVLIEQLWNDLNSSDDSAGENIVVLNILLATAEGIVLSLSELGQMIDTMEMTELIVKTVRGARSNQVNINYENLTLEPTGLRPIHRIE